MYATSNIAYVLPFSIGELEGTINANPQHFKDTVRVDLNTIAEELARIPCVQENTVVSHTTIFLNFHFYFGQRSMVERQVFVFFESPLFLNVRDESY